MQPKQAVAAPTQLPLPFEPHERHTFARYLAGANGELVERLRAPAAARGHLWLFGDSGVGKTHLLHAACHRHAGSSYIPAGKLAPTPATLAGYARFALVAIDDVHRWLGERVAEVALFDFYNRLSAAGGALLCSANGSPRAQRFALRDLASRLAAADCYRVAPLADEGRALLLAGAARERGLRLGADVTRYLLSRAPRDQGALLRLVDRLDRSSLAAQRPITVPFVKQTLCL